MQTCSGNTGLWTRLPRTAAEDDLVDLVVWQAHEQAIERCRRRAPRGGS
jgi:hypothetical protein